MNTGWVLNCVMTVLFVAVAAAGLRAEEAVVLEETWAGYESGGEPQAPWQMGGTGDRFVDGESDRDTVKVEGGWVVIDNAGTEPKNWNPGLTAKVELAGKALSSVSFTYRLDRDYTDASQIFFCLNQDKKSLVRIVLGKNYQFKGITNSLNNKKYEEVGHRFVPGEEVTIVLSKFDFAAKTFRLTWKSSKGGEGSRDGLSFCNPDVTTVNNISFGDSSIEKSQSKLYMKNIRVVAGAGAGN